MPTTFDYDEPSDTLEVTFVPDVTSTEIKLNDQILLHIQEEPQRAVGLSFMDFSVLGQGSEGEPQNIPLTGLNELEPEKLGLVLEILTTPPVTEILRLNEFPPSTAVLVPIPELVYFRKPEANE